MSDSVPIRGPAFWNSVGARYGVPLKDGALHYVVLQFTARMRIVLRTREELFSSTVDRQNKARKLRVVVNGNFYGVTRAGLLDAFVGHDPVAASATTAEGRLIEDGRVVGGRSAPRMFYFAQLGLYPVSEYTSAFGDPPGHAVAAIGGAGPFIIDGLRYGKGNLYKPGVPGGPAKGPPGAAHRANLIQRNNNTFVAAASRPVSTGKTVLGYCTREKKILVVVQEDGSAGISLPDLRDKLAEVGVDHSVFLDGSDSSMLMVSGRWIVRPGENKDETNVIGVGFE